MHEFLSEVLSQKSSWTAVILFFFFLEKEKERACKLGEGGAE